jgi:2',3'-cyclic-nucleotide 2'-phosphodiesterase (5'-nucleotidase family)
MDHADAECGPKMAESESSVLRHPDSFAGAGPRKLLGRPVPVKGKGALIGLLAATVMIGCGDRERTGSTAHKPVSIPAARLVVLTDLAGALEPCGCQSRPLGGLDKAATKLAELRKDKTPLLLVAAGDLWFGDAPEGLTSGADASTQEIWKAETLNDILARLGLAAATPGKRDLGYGGETFAKLAASAKFRVLPAPAMAGAPAPLSASWMTTVGGVRIGVVGASSVYVDGALEGPKLQQLTAAVQRDVKALREQGAHVVVALLSVDQRSGRRLAGVLPDVDFVVQGGLDSPAVLAPSRAGDAVILRASHNGQGLLVVDLYPRAGSKFVDISTWTRREESAALESQIRELDGKIRGWERDPKVERALVDQQRAKLTELQKQAKQLASPPEPKAAAFDARFEELAPEVKPDAQIGALMDRYDARINEHNRKVFANLRAPEAPAGTAHYVGSEECKSCHSSAHAWWSNNAHGHAYTTLETRNKQFNLSCVACHVTGYDKPGGAAVVQNEGLTHVGCESCHGPGSEHVAKPDTEPPPFVTRAPSEAVCKECHTPEHSDKFDFSTYVARLRAPGHGLPEREE